MDRSNAVNLRFISWNIHGRRQILPLLELLQTLDGDIVALQEVTAPAYQAIKESNFFSWSAFSLDLRPPLSHEKSGRKIGCAIFGKSSFEFKRSFLLDKAPLPERALLVDVESLAGSLTVSSFHAPPGANWPEEKPLSFLALAQWLAQNHARVIVGMDANTPATDHPDIQKNIWWYRVEEPLMLGATPLHELKDVLRLWLEAHPLEAAQLYALRPQGPLAISYYRRGGKAPGIPCRYDFIYVTSDFSVSQVRYLYDEAVRAGSDHAAVVSDLVFTPEENK